MRIIDLARDSTTSIPTDDWPHLYLRSRSLTNPYIVFTLAATLFAFLAIASVVPRPFSAEPHFLFLGAGFMLVETVAITRLCLVFGSTWHVASIVVCCIMVLLIAANELARRIRRLPYPLFYGALLALLLIHFALPLEPLLRLSLPLRILIAGGLMTAPLFFAGIIFPMSFRQSRNPAAALGWNLFGAVAGGMAEYLGLIVGLSALSLIAAGFYLASVVWIRPTANRLTVN
jgi:hypothetical protein